MRKLNTRDVFAAARIIRASGVRAELIALIQRAAESKTPAQEVGIDGFLLIMEGLAERKAESAIYEALAGPMECTAEEVGSMDLDVLWDKLTYLAEDGGLKRFFTYVSGILGKKSQTSSTDDTTPRS